MKTKFFVVIGIVSLFIMVFLSQAMSAVNANGNVSSANKKALHFTNACADCLPCSGFYYKCESDRAKVESDIKNNCGVGTDIIIAYIDC